MPVAPRALLPVVAVLAALAGALGVAASPWPGSLLGREPTGGRGDGEATVVRVVDGDTVVVDVHGRTEAVRLIGIDTPESVARDRPNECFGAEASERLAALLPAGTTVRLTRDVEPRDIYDRLLGYVERVPDGLFVNAAQVAGGYAEASHYPPNTAYRDLLDDAERVARAAGLGLWSACGSADVALPPGTAP